MTDFDTIQTKYEVRELLRSKGFNCDNMDVDDIFLVIDNRLDFSEITELKDQVSDLESDVDMHERIIESHERDEEEYKHEITMLKRELEDSKIEIDKLKEKLETNGCIE